MSKKAIGLLDDFYRIGFDSDLSFGCDPEIFIVTDDKKQEVAVIPKKELFDESILHLDGFAVEATPFVVRLENLAGDSYYRDTYIERTILGPTRKLVNRLNKNEKKYKISNKSIAEIPSDILENAPLDYVQFGCDPDFSMDGVINNRLSGVDPRKIKFRTAGGHIHVGFPIHEKIRKEFKDGLDPSLNENHMKDCIKFAKLFHYYYNLFPETKVFNRTPDGKKRLSLYGAGCPFRPKRYGIELRMFSNEWVFDPSKLEIIVKLVLATYGSLIKDIKL